MPRSDDERYLPRIMGSTQVETLTGLPTLGETNNYGKAKKRPFIGSGI